MIRILQVGLTSNRGGTESFVMSVYKAIDRSKIQFDFLVEYDRKLPFENEIINMGGRVFYDYYKLRDRDKIGYKSISDFFDEHPDINGVHVNANGISTTFRILEEAKRHNLPIRIMHSHNNGYMHKYTFKEKIYEVYAKLRMDSVVSKKLGCSSEAAEWMFGKKSHYQVIPNVIDVRKYEYNKDKRMHIRNNLKIDEKDILLGFVGSLNYQKDPIFLLRLAENLMKNNSRYKLLMLGQGQLLDEVESLINDLDIKDNTFLPGNVPNVEDYLQAMDIFVLPSRFEGFGIVLLEAQAAGLHCFTSANVVPQNTNVTGNVHFLQKESGPELWAKEIEKCKSIERYDGQTALLNSPYNSENFGELMEKVYLL